MRSETDSVDAGTPAAPAKEAAAARGLPAAMRGPQAAPTPRAKGMETP